jgi:membrane-associated HD superfamily phosphohydrolase
MNFVGIPNDSISSIKIPSGAVVVLYEHDDFQGSQIEFKNDVKNLVDFSWNDRASSIVVQSGDDRKRQEETQIFRSVLNKVVTAEKAAAAPKTCDTCCPPVPNPLIMPPASCSDVAVDLKSISNTLDTLTRLIRSQHLSDLCKVAGSIKPSDGITSLRVGPASVVPNRDIAQKADDLKSFVDSLLQQSNARVAFDASAQSAAAIKAKLDEEKAKVDALQKKQDEIEKKMRDDMAALAKAQAEQKLKDEQAKKDAADRAARAQKVQCRYVVLVGPASHFDR